MFCYVKFICQQNNLFLVPFHRLFDRMLCVACQSTEQRNECLFAVILPLNKRGPFILFVFYFAQFNPSSKKHLRFSNTIVEDHDEANIHHSLRTRPRLWCRPFQFVQAPVDARLKGSFLAANPTLTVMEAADPCPALGVRSLNGWGCWKSQAVDILTLSDVSQEKFWNSIQTLRDLHSDDLTLDCGFEVRKCQEFALRKRKHNEKIFLFCQENNFGLNL